MRSICEELEARPHRLGGEVKPNERDVYRAVKRAAKERDDDRSFWALFTVGCLLFFAAAFVLFCIWYANN